MTRPQRLKNSCERALEKVQTEWKDHLTGQPGSPLFPKFIGCSRCQAWRGASSSSKLRPIPRRPAEPGSVLLWLPAFARKDCKASSRSLRQPMQRRLQRLCKEHRFGLVCLSALRQVEADSERWLQLRQDQQRAAVTWGKPQTPDGCWTCRTCRESSGSTGI